MSWWRVGSPGGGSQPALQQQQEQAGGGSCQRHLGRLESSRRTAGVEGPAPPA